MIWVLSVKKDMDIGKLKYLAVAIGVTASVAFYISEGGLAQEKDALGMIFANGTAETLDENAAGDNSNDAANTDTPGDGSAGDSAGDTSGDYLSATAQSESTWSEENLKKLFKEAMQEEVTQIVRDAVRDEIVSVCEAGYLEQAIEEASVYTINEAKENEGKVNINEAGLEELKSLNGVGPTRAQSIIDYREENGAYTQIEDLMKVPGIKQATFDKFKDQIYV